MRVVLVDDHQLVLEGLRSLFARHPGWTVSGEAQNGEDAVRLVAGVQPDLVVLDLSMPVMNGIQATSKIREVAPKTKIIMLSMHATAVAEREAQRAGVDAYVSKSKAGVELMRIVNELFRA